MSLDVTSRPDERRPTAPARRHPAVAGVTAVVVAEAGGPALARVLAAVRAQTRAPDVVVGVAPPGSAAEQMGAALDLVVPLPARPASPDAVAAALAAADAGTPAGRPHGGTASGYWVWLLRDGAAPAPGALEELLRAVDLGPSIGIAGCKQRSWSNPSRLVDAGLTTTRLGRPMTGVERGEVDQGQLDHRDDVLAVSTSGMLARREVLEQLEGADDALTGDAAALDLCRRARLAGHRVVVVPGAVVHSAPTPRPTRRETAHLRLAHAPLPLLPLVVAALALGALSRLLLRVAAKDPGRGLRDLVQTIGALLRVDRVWSSRRRAARVRRVPRRTLRPLLADRQQTTRWHRERWGLRRGVVPRPVTPDASSRGRERVRGLLVPAGLAAGLTVLSATALHSLVGPGAVTGGALAAVPATAGELWRDLLSDWRATGLGYPGSADPFTAVLAAASTAAGGPDLGVRLLLLTALPLAGLGAWAAAGRATRSRALRGWAALTWAAAPALLVATGSGRLGAVLAHVALPYLLWAVTVCLQAPMLRYAWTPAAAGGLALAVVGAGAPSLVVPVLLSLAAVAVTYRTRALALVWTALPLLALLGPWVLDVAARPAALLAEPGVPLGYEPVPAWAHLLGHPVPPPPWPVPDAAVATTGPLALWAPVVLAAVVALLRGGGRAAVVRLSWVVVCLGLGAAVTAGAVVVADDGTVLVRGWPGPGTSLALLGLLAAVVTGADGLRERMGGHAFGWRQSCAGTLAVLAALVPVASLGQWAWDTATRPGALAVSRSDDVLPAVAADAARSPDRTHTLALRVVPGGVSAAVLRGDGPAVHRLSSVAAARAADPGGRDAADTAVDAAVAALVTGRDDVRPLLDDLAVGHVLVLPGGGAGGLATTLDSVVGLSPSGESGGARAWRVDPAGPGGRQALERPAALRVVGADGDVGAVLPATASGAATRLPTATDAGPRTLVLAERADAGWSAWLDGRRLEPAVHAGWAQAWSLPADGGRLVVDHRDPVRPLWSGLQLAVLVLTVLLAVPLPRRTTLARPGAAT